MDMNHNHQVINPGEIYQFVDWSRIEGDFWIASLKEKCKIYKLEKGFSGSFTSLKENRKEKLKKIIDSSI